MCHPIEDGTKNISSSYLHKKIKSLIYQTITFPGSSIYYLYIPQVYLRPDFTLLTKIGIVECLIDILLINRPQF